MKIGKNDAETLRLNGWGVGDVIERETGFGDVVQVRITAVGEENILIRHKGGISQEFGAETTGRFLVWAVEGRPWWKVQESGDQPKGGAPVRVPDLQLVPMDGQPESRGGALPDVDKDRGNGIPFTCKGSTPE